MSGPLVSDPVALWMAAACIFLLGFLAGMFYGADWARRRHG